MLTEYQRELLVKARELLLRFQILTSICTAIRISDSPNRSEDCWNLIKYIDQQLHPYSHYESWVCENHPEEFKKMRSNDFRAGRIAWIDWMLGDD